MNGKTIAEKVVDKMMSGDWFSQWLGISIVNIAEAKARALSASEYVIPP